MSNTNSSLKSAKDTAWLGLPALLGPSSAQEAARLLSPSSQWVVAHPVKELIRAQQVLPGFRNRSRQGHSAVERPPQCFFAGPWGGRV